jgi:hypothetical protein
MGKNNGKANFSKQKRIKIKLKKILKNLKSK